MSQKITTIVLGLLLSSSVFAADKGYFEIKKVTVKNVTAQYAPYMDLMAQPAFLDNCGQSAAKNKTSLFAAEATPTTDLNPLDTVNIMVDQIINIGKKIWNIVEQGKPVANIQLDSANALPHGVTCWSDLAGWSMPQSQVYSVDYENMYGMNVVSFAYRVIFTGKGNYNGVGEYITNATFMPANVNVSWGFEFNAQANIPSVFNTGSKEAPVAGMQMNMAWTVDSPMSHIQNAEAFFVSGDNKLVKLQ